jgi:hypothetical protein
MHKLSKTVYINEVKQPKAIQNYFKELIENLKNKLFEGTE